jgi:hypothetical protein
MPRYLTKSWQDKRPGFDYRIRWYQGQGDVKIVTITPDGEMRHYFTDREDALVFWQQFVRQYTI